MRLVTTQTCWFVFTPENGGVDRGTQITWTLPGDWFFEEAWPSKRPVLDVAEP